MNNEDTNIRLTQKIHTFLNGELSAEEQDLFWEEMFENPEIYEKVRFEASLRKVIRQKQAAPYDNNQSDNIVSDVVAETTPIYNMRSYQHWVIAVAAVLILVIGINLLKVSSPTDPATRVALLEDLHLIQEIDVFELQTIDATRSTDVDPDPLTELFDKSLLSVFSQETEEALTLYQEIIDAFPEDPRTSKAHFNTGILYYNENLFEDAINSFVKAAELTDDEALVEKSWWFKANAELLKEDFEMARYSMFIVYGMNGVFKQEAFRQLRILDAYLGLTSFEDIAPEEINP